VSNPVIRFGEIHLLAWVLAIPLFALGLRRTEDVFSFVVCAVFGVACVYMALSLAPRRFFDWLATRGLWPKPTRLVLLTVALIYLGATASLPFDPAIHWLMLVPFIAAAGFWIAAMAVALFGRPPVSESL
jgi:Na+/H+ antiporter NhaD/arsenite permease-like protein